MMGFYCKRTQQKTVSAAHRRTERPELNEPFSAGRPRTVLSLHVTQRSMISADLAADGPPQMRAKVKCQSSAKHFRVEGDPEAAGRRLRAVEELLRKVSGGVATCVVPGFGPVLRPTATVSAANHWQACRRPGLDLRNETAETKTKRLQEGSQRGLSSRQSNHLPSSFCCSFGTLASKLDPPKSEGTRRSGGCVQETDVVALLVCSG